MQFTDAKMMTLFPEWHSLGNLQEGKNDCFTYHMEKNYNLSKTLMWYCALMTMAISMKKAIQTTASNLQQTALDKTVTPFCRSHGPSTLFFFFYKHKTCNPVNFWQFWGTHSLLTVLTRSTWKTGSHANIAYFWT